MSKKAMRTVGYTSIALITITCTLVIINWVIDFVVWSTLTDGWAQALGTFFGLMIAVWVMYWQHARTLDREADAERSQTLNMLKAIRSEIYLFHPIIEHRLGSARQVWPNLNAKFPIFHSCAGQIGLLKNDRVRLAILNVYVRLGMFFGHADYYSTTAGAAITQLRKHHRVQKRIATIWSELDAAGHGLLPVIEVTISTLNEAIRELDDIRDHSAAPKSWV